MQPPADNQKTQVQTLSAEPPAPQKMAVEGQVKGVEATSGGLVRATLGAAAAAGAILVLFWLPAEYGIDPTGVGSFLGLTEMGVIKQQLYAEAEAAAVAASAPTGISDSTAVVIPSEPAITVATPSDAIDTGELAPSPWRDEVSYTLAPTKGIEVKLVMEKDAMAEFEWSANGALLNFDLHGDGDGNSVSYESGRGVPERSGSLTAAFKGNHGWFFRNRTDTPVTFTLRTSGDYLEMLAP